MIKVYAKARGRSSDSIKSTSSDGKFSSMQRFGFDHIQYDIFGPDPAVEIIGWYTLTSMPIQARVLKSK